MAKNPEVKLLLTADLHFRLPWFDWLRKNAVQFDMLAIAGDLLDSTHPSGMSAQMVYLYNWVQSIAKSSINLAMCTGNHDVPAGVPLVPVGVPFRKLDSHIMQQFARVRHWPEALKFNHFITVDGDQKLVRMKNGETLAVTCCPYRADGLLEVLHDHPTPWLVLHHEPPAATRLAAPATGSTEFRNCIQRLKPSLTLSGHVHGTARENDIFCERVGESWCVNCRQHPLGERLPHEPNVVMVDTVKKKAVRRRSTLNGLVELAEMDLD